MKDTINTTTKSNGKWVPAGLQSQAAETARKVYDDVYKMGADGIDSLSRSATRTVRRYPLQAAAAILTLGFLAGVAVRRGSQA